ncbi:hypothetical protein, conserved [Eimeria tenella]|uniref:Uncharacterized protein n=1 Tax=Eimeria tenella TaxID=5802 RepID=U6KLS4_EIMTE|nr:hypothetical protein, conserved [Eimeria tenella]CDJ38916.1 hypothetical protein, conserved [Eimeria tenella]|eukprot:XP_013229671.1 hypothetical protein, conserved [Eimeria tenella]
MRFLALLCVFLLLLSGASARGRQRPSPSSSSSSSSSSSGSSSSSSSISKEDPVLQRLAEVFAAALQKNPQLSLGELPGGAPEGAPLQQRALQLAEAVLQLGGAELARRLGVDSSLYKEVAAALQQQQQEGSSELLGSFLRRAFRWLLQKLPQKSSCAAVKQQQQQPEARLGHSPLRRFGYPVFAAASQTVLLQSRLPLNLLNNFPIPITVGAEDYWIQGRPRRVREFLECFGDYEAKAETLFPDGHWRVSAPEELQHSSSSSSSSSGKWGRPLYLQVQGTSHVGEVAELLGRAALDRVLKSFDLLLHRKTNLKALVEEALDPDGSPQDLLLDRLSGLANALPAGSPGPSSSSSSSSSRSAADGIEAILALSKYSRLPGKAFVELLQQLAGAETLQEKIEVFTQALQQQEADEEQQQHGWTHPEAVQQQKRILLVLTAYPKPDSSVRATYRMPSAVVSLQQIADALDLIDFEYK